MKSKRLIGLLCAAILTVNSAAQPTYAAAHSCGILQEPGSEEDFEEMDYEVLKTDEKGRQLLVRIGDVYVTSEYNDENKSSVTYYSNGPLAGENYIEKITTQEIEENEFHSVSVITDETAEGTVVEEYDKDDNLTRRVEKDGRTEVNEYDADGNLIKQISPYQGNGDDRLHTVYYEYDKDGHMILSRVPQAKNGDGSIVYRTEKYAYDKEGNMISYEKNVNAVGEAEQYARTDYKYADGRLVQTTEYDTDGSVLTIAQYVYDADGNMVRQYTGLTDPLTIRGLDDVTAGADTEYNVASYEYKDGQLIKEVDSDGNCMTYKYNGDGLLEEKTGKDGSRYQYTYREGLFREMEKIFYAGNDTDTPDEVREYIQETESDGSCGMLTEIRENGASVRYTYDEKGMLTEETDPNGNTIAYEYDVDENITGITVTDEKDAPVGETVYRYDENGTLIGIENGDGGKITDISYDENGNVQREAYGNGSVGEYGYQANGLPSDVTVTAGDGEKQVALSYVYSADGQMREKTDHVSEEKTEYRYDGMGRLKSETREEDGTETAVEYTYDDASGLLEVSENGESAVENTYASDGRLEACVEGEAEYDENGNLVRLGDTVYAYDARNRLIQVDMEGHTVCYGYDMNDKLISRSVDGKEEQFVWANDTLVAKLGETNTYYYTDLGENVKAQKEEEEVTYYLEENGRGDVAALADEEGAVIGKKEYSAFGNPEDTEEDTEFAHGYTGAFYDPVTRLVYLEARFYSPKQGIFLTEDTVTGDRTDAATLNRYSYCMQDPVNKTDRGGHWGTDTHKGMSAEALTANGYTDATMMDCVKRAVTWADDYSKFHYEKGTIRPVWSAQSKKRMNLSNLKGYCGKLESDQVTKKNAHRAPYHGRGDYDQYLAYLLGLSLQFKKGYQLTSLTLQNSNDVLQQINFDMLIHLSGIYETVTQKAMTRNIYSYLILGIALHLAEDLWAHVAVIDDSASVLRSYSQYFTDVNDLINALNKGVPVTYLGLGMFTKKGYYNKMHAELGERSTKSAEARKGIAKQSAARLVQFYKNGRIMHSGNCTLTGASKANAADIDNLKRLRCNHCSFVATPYQPKEEKLLHFKRYVCTKCDAKSADSCYRFYYRNLGKNNGLGYRSLD